MTTNPLHWPEIDAEPDKKQLKAAIEAQGELDNFYFQCFATKAGKKVLEHLVKHTIESGTWLASLPYEKAIAHGFAREGQNALVRNIQERIERGRTIRSKS